VPEFLHVLFNLVVKHSPVFFLAVLRFVSEKNEDKISKRAQLLRNYYVASVNRESGMTRADTTSESVGFLLCYSQALIKLSSAQQKHDV